MYWLKNFTRFSELATRA